jgi:hypothetical protein
LKEKVEALTTLEFTLNNTYTLRNAAGTLIGAYKISEDGKVITFVRSDTKGTFVDTIIELTKKKLLIVDQYGNKTTYTN